MSPPGLRVESTEAVLVEVAEHLHPASLLSPVERKRHDRLRQRVDRDDFVAARALARVLVLDHRGEPITGEGLRAVEFAQRCASCGGPHGRPVIPGQIGPAVSWAHAKGVVAAAVSDGSVGVDVERIEADPPPGLPGEGIAPWLTWTRAEAVTKLGLADLETALSWSAWLDYPRGSAGRRVELPESAAAWIADGADDELGVVWAAAWGPAA